LAFAIGRPVGGAVVRNRLRRRLRSIFTELAPDVPAGTYLIGADPSATTLDYGDLRRTLCTLLTEITDSPGTRGAPPAPRGRR
jgi:ribonuclease P protein component